MARFLSEEWVAALNERLATVDLGTDSAAAALESSLAASARQFRVRQVVVEVPPDGGERSLDLVADGDRVHLELAGADVGASPVPAATIRLAYADAAALAQGTLDPAGALAQGRVKVRGDLSLLVAAQGLLAHAAAVGGPIPATTY